MCCVLVTHGNTTVHFKSRYVAFSHTHKRKIHSSAAVADVDDVVVVFVTVVATKTSFIIIIPSCKVLFFLLFFFFLPWVCLYVCRLLCMKCRIFILSTNIPHVDLIQASSRINTHTQNDEHWVCVDTAHGMSIWVALSLNDKNDNGRTICDRK